ncbi:MAG: hypothetical protein EXQ52_12250 [Bryobacterales bacterium]|nr:hypothetical protein [Bryobacterales bacterium]
MAGRSSTTFKKRQKELARQDKQREKAAKREQRKVEKETRGPGEEEELQVLSGPVPYEDD